MWKIKVAMNNCIGIIYSMVTDKQPPLNTSLYFANVKMTLVKLQSTHTVLLNYVMTFQGNNYVALLCMLVWYPHLKYDSNWTSCYQHQHSKQCIPLNANIILYNTEIVCLSTFIPTYWLTVSLNFFHFENRLPLT